MCHITCRCDQPSVAVEVGPEPATACRARANSGGNTLPRFSARRRIPRQALAVKERSSGSSPVSKISDNEHTTAPLRNSPSEAVCSDVLSVQHSVSVPIPEFAQRPEEGTEIPSSVGGQDAGDVFPDDPTRPILLSNSKVGEHELTSWVSQALAKSRDAERLARRSSDEDVEFCIGPLLVACHVAKVRDIWVMVREDGGGELLDLREGQWHPPKRVPRLRRCLDAGAYGQVAHHAIPIADL